MYFLRRPNEEKKLQQKPLVFNATGYSRARGKVETDMSRNYSDGIKFILKINSSTLKKKNKFNKYFFFSFLGSLRKAYGQNEFRTVALDLTPGYGSNVGINVVGGSGASDNAIENEIIGRDYESRFSGGVSNVRDSSSSRTREYEEAINRELELKRQEMEKAAAAAVAKASGFDIENKGSEKNQHVFITHTKEGKFEASHDDGKYESGYTGIDSYGGSQIDSSRSSGPQIYRIQGGTSENFGTSESGRTKDEEDIIKSENERRLQAGAAAVDVTNSGTGQSGSRIYKIHGTIYGNNTRTYTILNNGTKVYETRTDSDSNFGEGGRNYEYEDALNREYEKRRQEAEAAASAVSRTSQAHGGGYRSYEIPFRGSTSVITGFDLKTQEEMLRREYEIKRQEAEAAAKELERIRLESVSGGIHNSAVYETVEALRREYEKKRLEAEAAAAAAAAASAGMIL